MKRKFVQLSLALTDWTQKIQFNSKFYLEWMHNIHTQALMSFYNRRVQKCAVFLFNLHILIYEIFLYVHMLYQILF
jgi:hypothetical protein